MAIDLASVNMVLDVILKLVLLGIFVGVIIVLKHLDKAIQQAGRSANTVHGLARKLHSATSARTIIRGLRKMHKKGEKIDVK
jgi:hypothetical protein